MVPEVGVTGKLKSSSVDQKKWVFQLWQGLVPLCSLARTWFMYLSQFDGSFSHSFLRVGLRYL